MTFEILTGRVEEHLSILEHESIRLHQDILKDYLYLNEKAKLAGFELKIASAFRSYERQEHIFNRKAQTQDLFGILRWSALPGASRHHWGTDFDIYDQNAVSSDYKLELVPEEFEGDGPFAPLHSWLDKEMQDPNFPFFRPYQKDLGGIAPERWHLSHRLSLHFENEYSFHLFEKNIQESNIKFKDEIENQAEEIFLRFVKNTSKPPWP